MALYLLFIFALSLTISLNKDPELTFQMASYKSSHMLIYFYVIHISYIHPLKPLILLSLSQLNNMFKYN